jgi:hypothetical protein
MNVIIHQSDKSCSFQFTRNDKLYLVNEIFYLECNQYTAKSLTEFVIYDLECLNYKNSQ